MYNNAIAFLRIRGPDLPYLHPLDDTHLHPDVYIKNTWAKKIVIDALEKEDDNRDDHRHHLLEVMRNFKRADGIVVQSDQGRMGERVLEYVPG